LNTHANPLEVNEILARYPRDESSLVMVLQDIQEAFHYLPCEALEQVADALGLPRSRVFSVGTFYKVFSLSPQGRTIIQVCKGTACHVRGAQIIEEELCRRLGVPVGGTTDDLGFTLRTVNCVGACAMAPVVIVGDRYNAEVKPTQVGRLIRLAGKQARPGPVLERPARPDGERPASVAGLEARIARAAEALEAVRTHVRVCGGPGCLAGGARRVRDALEREAADRGMRLEVDLEACTHGDGADLLSLTGCQGLCQAGVLVHLSPEDILYTGVKPADAPEIVQALGGGEVVERLLGESRGREDHPFYQGQTLRALAQTGRVDPESLDDYLAHGGFRALARALGGMRPEEVVEAVERSGLRGRGGAGFATGRKWRSALRAAEGSGRPPYVLCNGDEGDPGAFMDRAIMEGSPYQVIEGMMLGAFALGAREGWIYVRHEYPLAVERLGRAIETLQRAGLLGERILGADWSFDIRISRGGGAFVCGESTALMRSLEGKVGEPRAKYVRSVERGLHDAPTVLNNVETWALVPGIVLEGPEWLSSMGTERSKGTKAFSLVGQVARTGLVEVPMGTSIRRLVFEVGGGMRDGRTFKAVQTGGPSGGCLPADKIDLPIDFDELTEAGSMMGSGGMIVMDEGTCMVNVARYFVDFLLEESCGKCGPCRLGLPQLSHLLGRVERGEATEGDLDIIEDVGRGMTENSLCGLGKSAANPVLSTLRHFRDEYLAHIEGRCPAGVCRDLIHFEITATCDGCGACVKLCPTDAITGGKDEVHVIDQDLCTKCGVCGAVCTVDAVATIPGGAG